MTLSRGRDEAGAGLLAALHLRAGNALIRVKHLLGPRLTLGVRLMALDSAGRVFLVRHSYLPGLHFPGGAVDPGETCLRAVEREAAEEGGLTLGARPGLFNVYMNPTGGRHDHVVLFVARDARQDRPWAGSLEIISAGFHPADPVPDGATRATRDRIAEVLTGEPASGIW